MDSDPFENYESQPHQGLTRYRSAPCSYFTSLLDKDSIIYDEFLKQPSSPDTERILTGLMNHQPEIFQRQPKQEEEPQPTNYSQVGHKSFYQNDMDSTRAVGIASSGLLRQSSSPAGLFLNNLNSIEVSGAMRFDTSYREASYSPATRFDPVNYASAGQPSSSSRQMSGRHTDSSEIRGYDEGRGNNYDIGFSIGSWDDSGVNALDAEDGDDIRDPSPQLAHHLSLPKSSSDTERLLQFQDSVPCKIRAKRGFATHPRSIAERVRRTKISERIRKLQDLVPNMDKQTNTAEMLDLAVDYIKELQEKVKALSDSKSKCVCPSLQMQ